MPQPARSPHFINFRITVSVVSSSISVNILRNANNTLYTQYEGSTLSVGALGVFPLGISCDTKHQKISRDSTHINTLCFQGPWCQSELTKAKVAGFASLRRREYLYRDNNVGRGKNGTEIWKGRHFMDYNGFLHNICMYQYCNNCIEAGLNVRVQIKWLEWKRDPSLYLDKFW